MFDQNLVSEVESFVFWDIGFKGKLEVGAPQSSADFTRVLISLYTFIAFKMRRCLPAGILHNVNSLLNCWKQCSLPYPYSIDLHTHKVRVGCPPQWSEHQPIAKHWPGSIRLLSWSLTFTPKLSTEVESNKRAWQRRKAHKAPQQS